MRNARYHNIPILVYIVGWLLSIVVFFLAAIVFQINIVWLMPIMAGVVTPFIAAMAMLICHVKQKKEYRGEKSFFVRLNFFFDYFFMIISLLFSIFMLTTYI